MIQSRTWLASIFVAITLSAVFTLVFCSDAQAQADFNYKGEVSSDLRVSIPGKDAPDSFPDFAWIRSDNRARLTAAFTWATVRAVTDLSLVFSGRNDAFQLSDNTDRTRVDPFYFESDALYVEIIDFIVEGTDLRLGRQIIDWGSADMFNPTSVVNPLDLEDRLDFGAKVANEMVVLSINPGWSVWGEEDPIVDEVNLTLLAVPLFRQGLIPSFGLSAFESGKQFRRFVNSDTLIDLLDVLQVFEDKGGSVVFNDPRTAAPDFEIDNTQLGARFGIHLLGVDFHAMYYYGYDHNPQPSEVNVETELVNLLPPDIQLTDKTQLINIINNICPNTPCAALENTGVVADIDLVYPRVHVVGGDIATSLDFLGGLGLWAEVAFTFHDGVDLNLISGDDVTTITQVEDGWFWKLTAGLDYTITEWWYANVQYVHGFADEFGTENLRDYVVAGFDFKTFDEQVLIRLFGILSLEDDDVNKALERDFEASFLAFPQLSFLFWQNTELIAGALIHVGSDESRFGNRTSGPNTVFVKGKYAF